MSPTAQSLEFPKVKLHCHQTFLQCYFKGNLMSNSSWDRATSKQPVDDSFSGTTSKNNSNIQRSFLSFANFQESNEWYSWDMEKFWLCWALMLRSFKLSEWKNVDLNQFEEASHVLSFQILSLRNELTEALLTNDRRRSLVGHANEVCAEWWGRKPTTQKELKSLTGLNKCQQALNESLLFNNRVRSSAILGSRWIGNLSR